MKEIIQSLLSISKQGESCVLATVLSQTGSTPRTSGAQMIVQSIGGIIGTIGGGLVEAEVIKTAREVLRNGGLKIKSIDLRAGASADSIDVVCGGHMTLLIERIDSLSNNFELYENLLEHLRTGKKSFQIAALPTEDTADKGLERCLVTTDQPIIGQFNFAPSVLDQLIQQNRSDRTPSLVTIEGQRFLIEPTYTPGTVYLFGAGHVAQQIARLTDMVGFRTIVLDDRQEFANRERFQTADEIKVLSSFDQAFDGLEITNDSYLVIVSRGHTHDEIILNQALKTSPKYIGMIGSRRKRDTVYKSLLKKGFSENEFKRINCPIGLKIKAESPQEIAVSIIAELISVRAE
ncbi:XdhC family protein [bacterium]|nr:XdhC family protein [bacterium]